MNKLHYITLQITRTTQKTKAKYQDKTV